MLLSDISITRPVFASVISLLLIILGAMAFSRMPLRELPAIDPPVVSIDTRYRGASASIVETRITQLIEDRIAGVEGIKFIESTSEDGRSRITIEFYTGHDIDTAINDVRDRVSGVLAELPVESDPPEVQKVDSNDDAILWLNLVSDSLSVRELTDYAERYLVDRFSILPGVARVRIGGQQRYAMRIWLDREQLAAHQITVDEIEAALRAENVELPAGNIESRNMQFAVRLQRTFNNAEDFAQLVVGRGDNGHLVRLADVARVEKGTEEDRTFFRGNGIPMVGIGVIKQSTANTIEVVRAAKAEKNRLIPSLPKGMELVDSYDTSIFVENAIFEVYKTLAITIGLVILVIYLFLRSIRATLVPAVTVPVSLIATFFVLMLMGFTVNLFTLLALVLAIGLIVDDAIVVVENIHRRMEQHNESALVAAYRGTRQVGFAVIATTLVLVAVFLPIAFMTGNIGRLFSEFGLTMATAVTFSSIIALSASAALASKILQNKPTEHNASSMQPGIFTRLQQSYQRQLRRTLNKPAWVLCIYLLALLLAIFLSNTIATEYAPKEDRGSMFVMVNGPEGASHAYMKEYMDEIETRLMSFVEQGEFTRLLVRSPRGFSNTQTFNTGVIIILMEHWRDRRDANTIIREVKQLTSDLPGVRAFPIMRQSIGGRVSKPLRFVLGGGTYDELAQWRDILLDQIKANNPGLNDIDWDYKETQPQIDVQIDYDRAAELGVSVSTIGRTLESLLGSRQVTTYLEAGEEYDVLIEGERESQRTTANLENIYVESSRSDTLIPLSNLVQFREYAGSRTLNRYNRLRSLTLEANLEEGYALGEALEYLERLVAEHLPERAVIDYKGQSRDFKYASSSIVFTFALGIAVVFLVLAAQFESYIHPFTILLTVPLAIAGGLLGLWVTGNSLNMYSQIGLIMLVGLAAKNGILIVEFTNQLRDQGTAFHDALVEAATVRLRPIMMTAITTIAGTIPLIASFGAGAETRRVIGVTVCAGIIVATLLTLYVVPAAYSLLARNTGAPGRVKQRLNSEIGDT